MNRKEIAAQIEQQFASLPGVTQEQILQLLRPAVSSEFEGLSSTAEFHRLIDQLDCDQIEATKAIIDKMRKH